MSHLQQSISLIICSRNRANQLKSCLQKIPHQVFEEFQVELILVDSFSDDETFEVMTSHADIVSYSVQIMKAKKSGLGYARNLGVEAAKGELLIFTDDDCYLQEDYIEQLRQHFDYQSFQFCGGRILLWDQADAMVSINYQEQFELIPAGSFLAAGKIQGANMVIHQEVLEKVGGFHPQMGAGTPLRCEDIEFLGRACMAGFTGAHVPQLVVYHHHRRQSSVEVEQLRRENDIGRGVYYAAMCDHGFFDYWAEGMRRSLTTDPGFGQNQCQVLANELQGAQRYFAMKAQGKL